LWQRLSGRSGLLSVCALPCPEQRCKRQTLFGGEDVLAEVQSSWCCIDAKTLRPARIGEHPREFFFPHGE
jgi:hypothetical protein